MSTIVTQLQNQAIADAVAAKITHNRPSLTKEQGEFIYKRRQEGVLVRKIVTMFYELYGRIIDDSTVTRYAKDPDRDGQRTGRPLYLDPAIEGQIFDVFNVLRGRGAPININTLQHIGMGVLKVQCPHKVDSHLGRRWARNFCQRHGLSFRKRTTSRIVSLQVLVSEGTHFYIDLSNFAKECAEKGTRLDPRLTFNVDEFFVHSLLCQGQCTWTRTKDEHGSVSIPIKDSKAGFSASILTSASGHSDFLQLIFKGKTNLVHAGIKKSDVLECHSGTDSHFQTSVTWQLWCKKLEETIKSIKAADPTLADVQPILFLDCASQHFETAACLPGVKIFAIPPKLTHVFQPADQFIIANLRQKTKLRFNEFLQKVVEETTIWKDPKAGEELTADNAQTRCTKAFLTYEAFRELSPEAVVSSWVLTGIMHHLFGSDSVYQNDYTEGQKRIASGEVGDEMPSSNPCAGEESDDEEIDVQEVHPTLRVCDEEEGSEKKEDERNSKRERIEGRIALTAAERKAKQRRQETYLTQKEEEKVQKKAARQLAKAAKEEEAKKTKEEAKNMKEEAKNMKEEAKKTKDLMIKQEKAEAKAAAEAEKRRLEEAKVPVQKRFNWEDWSNNVRHITDIERQTEVDLFADYGDPDVEPPVPLAQLHVPLAQIHGAFIPRLGLCAPRSAVPVPSDNGAVSLTVPATVPVTQSDEEEDDESAYTSEDDE